MTVTLTHEGLHIAGQTIPVYAGTVHYWRLERALWPQILDQVKQLGFQMVETYIPWAIHETSPGHYDWGSEDDRKDVEGFIKLCEERSLWLIVRPGPLINAELTDFGFPEWVLLDPAVQAHTAVGSIHYDAAWGLHPPHQFPVPSYASEAFYAYSAGWFDAICPIIARHLAPNGCIVAVQSDNETCYLFHEQTYATDYSPDSLKLYRLFLEERYHQIETLNAAYHTTYADFTEIEGPRDCQVNTRKDLPWHLDWVAYKEYQITWSVARFARMLREREIVGVPIFHDVAFQQRTPLDVARMEAHHDIDWVGMNLYRNKEGYASAVRQTRFLVGSTQLPFVPEFGCGIWSHHPLTPMPNDQELITLATLMHGLKALNLYMLVERDRWQGSAITRHGMLRPEYADFYQRLTHFLHSYQFWRFARDRQVLVLRNYDLGRYTAMTSTLNYAHADLYGLPPELFTTDVDLDLRWDATTEADEHRTDTWFGTLLHTLQAHSMDYDLADTHITSQQLAQYPLVLLQATDFMDINDQRHILAYIESGGTVVVGPGLPYTDPTLTQTGILNQFLDAPGVANIGAGRLIWAETAELPDLVGDLVPEPAFRSADPSIDLAVMCDDEQILLFAANPTDSTCATTLQFNGSYTLRAAWQNTETLQGHDSVALTLPPYSVHIWEALHD
ncbi:MAG: hypothetical protein GFH27_549291n243 [Chloroflexi bacterium AL-W]|nr:hypothetical protein [Chloroflexi bacterium AL-N1]NOK67289.1 hypothetical protein [Chloroflexi bacterium AL-N10]NOK75217.1 hypothetical protein [Chloroflexi bacterium AL-N5]NOK82005.1 hypothetical protein [Chloroflexi bacterium AL-W]NOK89850.1 hypothetical protein [Chloroflexi bacterium AL-N15]